MKFLQTFNWQTYDEARKGAEQASHTATVSSANAHQLNSGAAHSYAQMNHEAAAHAHGKAEQAARGNGLFGALEMHGSARRNHERMAAEHQHCKHRV
jgi:hypothetical protein